MNSARLTPTARAEVTRQIEEAVATGVAIPPVVKSVGEFSIEEAYEIQNEIFTSSLGDDNPRAGVKLGLTSRAKQLRMKVEIPVFGQLSSKMDRTGQLNINCGDYIHPRVEPEIVFVLRHPIEGPYLSRIEATDAVAAVYAGVEIIDSRFRDFSFSAADVIADNTSAAGFILGNVSKELTDLDLETEAVLVHVNGEVLDSATGAAILGNPIDALMLAARHFHAQKLRLEAGWLVLSGAMTDAIALQPGSTVTFEYSHLGSITLRGV